MIPLLFGGRARPLVGLFIPSEGDASGRLAVVCPPFGVEYLRSHRALRVLTDRLAEAGLHVVRFDWFGTGDSGGDHVDLTLKGAAADVREAIDEGISVAGGAPRGIVLVGHRHGTLAAALAARDDERVERLVLWDPVAGRETAAEWRRRPPSETSAARWVDGFPVSRVLLDEMESLGGEPWAVTDRIPSLIIRTGRALPEGLRARAESGDWTGTVKVFPGPGPWEDTSGLGAGAVPRAALAEIARWCP